MFAQSRLEHGECRPGILPQDECLCAFQPVRDGSTGQILNENLTRRIVMRSLSVVGGQRMSTPIGSQGDVGC